MSATITVQPLPWVYTDKPEEVGRAIENAIGVVTASVAIRVLRTLAERTPKQTGLAAASWIASVGIPSGSTGGDKKNVDRSLQLASIDRLMFYKLEQGQIFISNNQPYIMGLNSGSSNKAPAGFIESSLETVEAEFGLVDAILV